MATTADRSTPDAAASIRVELRPERDAVRVVAVGELDLAGARSLAAQLRELRDVGFERIVLDVRELVLLAPGLIALVVSDARLGDADGCELSLVEGAAAGDRDQDGGGAASGRTTSV